jgi:3-dehydroquinate dehydratase-2
MARILVLNGPNLNMLGTREPATYGSATLADVEATLRIRAGELGCELDCRQSNHEGELVTWIQAAMGQFDALVMNPGAYTHTSVAIPDAIRAVSLPVWEVHISNIHRREPFRQHSYISPIAEGVICGYGIRGYVAALEAAVAALDTRTR